MPGEHLQPTARIVAAYVGSHLMAVSDVDWLIHQVHKTIAGLGLETPVAAAERGKPAVPIARSIHDDHLICLEDGAKLKMLKRYLRARYNMSAEEYRRRWNLPPDYPMVAPLYARMRSDLAKQIGLGRGVRRRG